MRIYVAAKFEDQALVQETYRRLREAGHSITLDWTALPTGDRHWGANAIHDLAGVLTADAVVLHPHERGKGLYVELGAALAHDIPVFVVGGEMADDDAQVPCLFMFHPMVWIVRTLDDAMARLAARAAE